MGLVAQLLWLLRLAQQWAKPAVAQLAVRAVVAQRTPSTQPPKQTKPSVAWKFEKVYASQKV
jgi:hypothetical protein